MENWVIKNRKADFDKIMEKCGTSEALTRCLVNRGYEDIEVIRRFLHPSLKELNDPMLLKDMDMACEILTEKIRSGKRIRIIGDYDVDGIISVYILYQALKRMGAQVDYDIPDRIRDGYGINMRMVEEAHEEGIDTLLTCDNGIVAMDQIRLAKEYGMTVIVTDHHNLLEEAGDIVLPPADAVINSNRPDCEYPFKGLCGAAISYKLVEALLGFFDISNRDTFAQELLSYVAIATVCDVMDLVGENRIIVKEGLKLLAATDNKGLLALMEENTIEANQLSAFHLGFVIGPCLNASGRLDTAKRGLELLLVEDTAEAGRMATELKQLNDTRKTMTAENVEKAIWQIEEGPLARDKVLVVYLEDCHESIAGIIAGRLRERYHRPTIVLTDAEGGVKGSGRSIEAYNMIEELMKYRDLMLKLGGHPMAAGLSLAQERVELLRKSLNDNTTLTMEMLIPKVTIDALLPFGYLSEELVEELRQLEPFGKGNEKPLFAERELRIKSALVIGKNASGIRFLLENQSRRQMQAVYFGDVNGFFDYISATYGKEEAEGLKRGRGSKVLLTITYYPRINEYKGFKSIQLMIQNFR